MIKKYGEPERQPGMSSQLATEIPGATDIDTETGDVDHPSRCTSADRFPSPYKNELRQPAPANGGALPPDLSVIAKASRSGGAGIPGGLPSTGFEAM